MIERVLKLFLGGVFLVIILKYPDYIVSGMQAFVDAVVRTADAVVHLKLSTSSGKG
jgi:hypothetical protein